MSFAPLLTWKKPSYALPPDAPLSRDKISEKRLVAPALSVIVAELGKRPAWQKDEPFAVPAELYKAAKEEMKAVMKKRGFKWLPYDESLATQRVEHFMVYGAVVVAA